MPDKTKENNPSFDIARVDNVYKDLRIQLVKFKKENEQTVFDYETKKGNKAARSHIYKLRLSKGAITKAHKEAKAEALKFGTMLDDEKKKLLAEIDDMIAVHDKPLKEIEEREKARIAKIQKTITDIETAGSNNGFTSVQLQGIYDHIFTLDINEDYAEFREKALTAKDATLKRLAEKIEAVKKSEAEQAEFERLRKEELARKQKEHDECVAREAKERAEAEAKARAERLEQEKLAAEQRAANAERQRIAAEERAKIEAQQAAERARQEEVARQQAEAQRIRQEQEARLANERHVNSVHEQIKQNFMQFHLTNEQANFIVHLISSGQIKNVSINY